MIAQDTGSPSSRLPAPDLIGVQAPTPAGRRRPNPQPRRFVHVLPRELDLVAAGGRWRCPRRPSQKIRTTRKQGPRRTTGGNEDEGQTHEEEVAQQAGRPVPAVMSEDDPVRRRRWAQAVETSCGSRVIRGWVARARRKPGGGTDSPSVRTRRRRRTIVPRRRPERPLSCAAHNSRAALVPLERALPQAAGARGRAHSKPGSICMAEPRRRRARLCCVSSGPKGDGAGSCWSEPARVWRRSRRRARVWCCDD